MAGWRWRERGGGAIDRMGSGCLRFKEKPARGIGCGGG